MLSDRLGYLLKHVQARLTEESRSALEPFDLDGRNLAVLSVIAAEDPLSQLDVAARLGVDRTSIGDLLDALEDRDLIERRRSAEDRRRNIVALTAKGETVLDQAERIRADVERKFLAPLGKAGAERFRADLQTLLENPRQD